MKKILLIVTVGLMFSCKTESDKEYNAADTVLYYHLKDSIEKAINAKVTSNMLDDTLKLVNAPVKVTKARITQEEYSSYKSISLSYKNVSTKNIEAIRFRWYGLNAFGEPADMGNSFSEGFGGGYMDDGLKINKTESGTWSILSRDAKKVVAAWPIEVVFSDGTKWEIEK